jgi:hypothetical protein
VWYFSWINTAACLSILYSTACPHANPDDITDQLIVILNEISSYTSAILGSINSDPYNNQFVPYLWNSPYAFSSVEEYLDCYRSMSPDFNKPEYVEELFSCFSQLTHGDLLSRDILVEGSKITGILDWETGRHRRFLNAYRIGIFAVSLLTRSLTGNTASCFRRM